MVEIRQASGDREIKLVRRLFLEYQRELGIDLCFQGFEAELAGLPGDYAPPDGRLFLAYSDGELAGCVALHRFRGDVCEMKRLFLRAGHRGSGLGRMLAEAVIAAAQEIGYARMVLDTLPSMKTAQALYLSLGFHEIPSYRENPVVGTLFMELSLRTSSLPACGSSGRRFSGAG